ncbi:hypothetical protein BJ508DRAFT_135023 [Ascobolus immersus RN42]|uniref:Methyltransferase type 11 domain-containing protein n=1 Tax=Ascobolus immersus RN42 TaxID=1160509 RepID=A0A3N4IK53_ASCIM|nr:hypothetical protein BJ508DRAFT_135023 [Ascobolus immersus RN42]
MPVEPPNSSKGPASSLRTRQLQSSIRLKPSFSTLRPKKAEGVVAATTATTAPTPSPQRSLFHRTKTEHSPENPTTSSNTNTSIFARLERRGTGLPKPTAPSTIPKMYSSATISSSLRRPSKDSQLPQPETTSRLPTTTATSTLKDSRLRNVIKRKNSTATPPSSQPMARTGSTEATTSSKTEGHGESSRFGSNLMSYARRRSGSISSMKPFLAADLQPPSRLVNTPSPFSAESTGAFSHTSTTSSLSSTSPGPQIIPATKSRIIRGASPSRPPVTRGRSGSGSGVTRGSFHEGLNSVRESTTSTSSSSTIRQPASRKNSVTDSAQVKPPTPTAPTKPAAPARRPTYPAANSSASSAPPTPYSYQRPSPRIPSPQVTKTPSPGPIALGTFRSKSSNSIPVRPSRENTPELNLLENQAIPVIQSGIQKTRSRSASSNLPQRKGSASLTPTSPPATTVMATGRRPSLPRATTPQSSTEKRSTSTERTRQSPVPANKPSTLTKAGGLFSRGRARDQEMDPKLPPISGTGYDGHHGFGSWGRTRQRSNSGGSSVAGSSRKRSESTGSSNGGRSNSRTRGSDGPDDFLLDRVKPVVLSGGAVVDNQNIRRGSEASSQGTSMARGLSSESHGTIGSSAEMRAGRRTPGTGSGYESSEPEAIGLGISTRRALRKKIPKPAPINTSKSSNVPAALPSDASDFSRATVAEPSPQPPTSASKQSKLARWGNKLLHRTDHGSPLSPPSTRSSPAIPQSKAVPRTAAKPMLSAHYALYDADEQAEAAELEEKMMAMRKRQREQEQENKRLEEEKKAELARLAKEKDRLETERKLQQQEPEPVKPTSVLPVRKSEDTELPEVVLPAERRRILKVGRIPEVKPVKTPKPPARPPPGLVHPEFAQKKPVTDAVPPPQPLLKLTTDFPQVAPQALPSAILKKAEGLQVSNNDFQVDWNSSALVFTPVVSTPATELIDPIAFRDWPPPRKGSMADQGGESKPHPLSNQIRHSPPQPAPQSRLSPQMAHGFAPEHVSQPPRLSPQMAHGFAHEQRSSPRLSPQMAHGFASDPMPQPRHSPQMGCGVETSPHLAQLMEDSEIEDEDALEEERLEEEYERELREDYYMTLFDDARNSKGSIGSLGAPFRYSSAAKEANSKFTPDSPTVPYMPELMTPPTPERRIPAGRNTITPTTPFSISSFIKSYDESRPTSFESSNSPPSPPASPRTSYPTVEDSTPNGTMTAPLQREISVRLLSLTTTRALQSDKLLLTPTPEPHSSHRVLIIDALGTDDWSYYLALTHPSYEVYNLSATPSINAEGAQDKPKNHTQIFHPSTEGALPFPGGYFSKVCLRFLTPTRFLAKEARRVLEPDGWVEIMGVKPFGYKSKTWEISADKGWDDVKKVRVCLPSEGDVGKVGKWWWEKCYGDRTVGPRGVGWEVIVGKRGKMYPGSPRQPSPRQPSPGQTSLRHPSPGQI